MNGSINERIHVGTIARWRSFRLLRGQATASTVIAILYIGAGCVTGPDPTRTNLSEANHLSSNEPATLKAYYQRLHLEGESNATLNRMRIASAAIGCEEWKKAEQALDEIIPEIEALGAADPRSRDAMGNFQSEEIKKFKGEAYERSMVYFLRGLLYLRVQDWNNARACFKSVQVQDAVKKDPSLQANWASADWLEGWCNWNLGETSTAQDCWKRAKRSNKNLFMPSKTDNAVCVSLIGFGPVKVAQGRYGETLGYKKASSNGIQIRVNQGDGYKIIPVLEDLFAQASSRGLRKMDAVNAQKADNREGTEIAGDVLTTAGIGTIMGGIVTDDTTVAAAGLGVAAVGMATKGIGSSIQPKADVRAWDLLPATIHILPMTLSGKDQTLEFQALDERGTVKGHQTLRLSNSSQPQLILLIER